MAPRRKLNKLLTCFYCGRRSTIRYDGHIDHFECEKCNATNHLDTNGEITDPPVATNAIPDAPTYVRRGSTPPPSNQVFCKKCMNNQHLFISSLAQYFPDDPNDPEYAERERNYYKFRRGLEKRYPQVCADCEPRVHEQLDKAAYTAKTDHLRRLLDRSAQTRVLLSTTPGHYWHYVGRWLWILSLVLQILWHVLLVKDNVLAEDETIEPKSLSILAARALDQAADYLPSPSRIMSWSFWTSAMTIWWNPRWVETYNGFTKHIVGRRGFYSYQVLILMLKLIGWRDVYVLPASAAARLTVHVVGHTFMATSIYCLYIKAYRSVHTDHRPLWVATARDFGATQTLAPSEEPTGTRAGTEPEQSMADILDEILNDNLAQPVLEPSPYVSKFPTYDEFDHMPDPSRRRLFEPTTAPSAPNPFNNRASALSSAAPTSSLHGLGGLSLTDRPGPRTRAQVRNSQQLQYETEMDWAPTQSQHRAFNTVRSSQSHALRFNETPVNEKAGAFWAKVPPAPTTPAQRIFNPPNLPIIRTTPATTAATTNAIQFQGSKLSSSFGPSISSPNGETTFANPTFFPKQVRDERDALSGLFDTSLAISPTRAVRPEVGQSPQSSAQEQTLGSKMLYLSLGLGLAIVGNLVYNYALQFAESPPVLASFITH